MTWRRSPRPANSVNTAQSSDDLGRYYDRMRDCIREENELVNHRMSWALIIQGYLFTAFGAVAASKDMDHGVRTAIQFATPPFGIVLIFISACGLYGAYRRIKHLHYAWDTVRSSSTPYPVPSGIGENDFKGRGLGIVTGYGILSATGLAWSGLLSYLIYRSA